MTRAVLVTGGTGALGGAVTDRFLQDGHRVTTTTLPGLEDEPGARKEGVPEDRFHAVPADVTDADSVSGLVEETLARIGRIDVLAHLVGGWAGGQPVQDHSPETWDRMMALNLRSGFLCSRAVLPAMRRQGWGRLVFVSSRAARSERKDQAAYAVAKAGITVLAEAIAEENRDMDVTANVVAPSVLDTPANRSMMADADPDTLVPVEAVAKVVAFLASQEAGQLRGAWLPVFGRA